MGNAQRLAAVVERALGGPLPVGLRAWDGSRAGPPGDPTVVLHRRRALWHLASRPGELGLARAYVSGDLDVSGDLKEGLRRCWAAGRSGSLRPPRLRVPWPGRRSAQEARLRGRLHAPGRDRAAIAHHYDLGNEFYRLILDDSMAYSCGYWRSAEDGYGLADAQHDKLELICRKLDLRPGMRLLDVGCGWGSLVLHAARHHGVHATGITISAQQREFVTARVAELGLSSLVDVRLTDYREFRRRALRRGRLHRDGRARR